jgi:xylan 1,4-beta-xylosidase
VVSRHSDTKKITAIAYNYPKEFEEAVPASRNASTYMKASPKKLSLKLRGLKPGATFTIETLDKEHGNAYDAWEKMGCPHSPNREQTEALKRAGWATVEETVVVDGKGRLTLERILQPWTVMLITEE